MSTLYIMSGIPGSGKTTAAKKLGGIVVSADELRKEFFGSAELQYTNEILIDHGVTSNSTHEEKKKIADGFIYKCLNERINALLLKKLDCIYDATNVTRSRREAIVKQFKSIADEIICVFLEASLDLDFCLERNRRRERYVPEKVIIKMNQHLEIPQLDEGYDRILTVKENGYLMK